MHRREHLVRDLAYLPLVASQVRDPTPSPYCYGRPCPNAGCKAVPRRTWSSNPLLSLWNLEYCIPAEMQTVRFFDTASSPTVGFDSAKALDRAGSARARIDSPTIAIWLSVSSANIGSDNTSCAARSEFGN